MRDGERHIWAGAAVIAAVLAIALVVAAGDEPCGLVPELPCGPTDEAAALVPADAYAYLHIAADRESEQALAVAEIAGRLPQLSQVAAEALAAAAGRPSTVGLLESVEPWLGEEAALALVRGARGQPSPLVLLSAADRSGASSFAARLGGGAGTVTEYRGVELTGYEDGLTTAQHEGFLLLGRGFAVRSAIDTAAGGPALDGDPAARRARLALPDERIADLYVSETGVETLVEGEGAVAEQIDTFVDLSATRGVGAALSAQPAGIGLTVVSLLDPRRTAVEPGFFSAFPAFTPAAAGVLPANTLAMLDFADPASTLRGLLDQASAASPALAEAFNRLAANLRKGGVDLEEGLLPLLRGEATLAFSAPKGRPRATVVVDGVEEEEVRPAVAQLQAPLIDALDPVRTGQAPTFSEREIAGVTARSLRLTPVIDLTYAVKGGRLVVSSDPGGVAQVLGGGARLEGDPAYRAVAPPAGSRISALVFLDIEGLAEVAVPRAVTRIRSYARFREEIRRLGALGLAVESDDDRLQTTAFLNIE